VSQRPHAIKACTADLPIELPVPSFSVYDSLDASRPTHWGTESTVVRDWSLQQIAPYIGRIKTTMARSLIYETTQPGDLLIDPFCGCGIIPYEAAVMGRRVLAGDWNPYAVVLTKAKLFAPNSFEEALNRLTQLWLHSREHLKKQDLRSVPLWVRAFFHNETLRSALAFRDSCHEFKDTFLLACLLGILHHQRPGFLSYPSSHLVPYLRNRKFPRNSFPDLYRERDVLVRLIAKLKRLYKNKSLAELPKREVLERDARRFPARSEVQAVITSPPYMNELDYVRDNRLRLWFIDRALPKSLDFVNRRREEEFHNLLESVLERLSSGVRPQGFIVLVLGEVTRRSKATPPESIAQTIFANSKKLRPFYLVSRTQDLIPDIRRSRRECRGTKIETILAYQKAKL